MERWIITRDTREAAAFGTCGMPLRIKSTFDELSGGHIVRFQVGEVNVEGTMVARKIRGCINNGSLPERQPDHPYLTIQRGFKNREMILDCANKGARIELVRVVGTKVFNYVAGDRGLPGVKPGDVVMRTGDLKMVAALGVVGCRLLKIEGERGNFVFTVEAVALVDGKPVDGGGLVMAWRTDKESVPWAHPFAQAARGLYTRERLLDAVDKCRRQILVRKKGTIKSAVVEEDATDEAWDAVADFFG